MDEVGLERCLAHGQITLHLRTEAGDRALPAALYERFAGEEALRQAGPRVRRVARWDAAGWAIWWELLAQLAGDRPAVAALPPLNGGSDFAFPFTTAHIIPPTIAVRAASPLPAGVALYLGAFSWEVSAFGHQGMDEPVSFPPGLDRVYRGVVAQVFRQERRALLPIEVPAMLQAGLSFSVDDLVEGVAARLEQRPAVLGGEDDVVVGAVATALEGLGHEVALVDPLAGLERLVCAAGGLG